MQVQAHGMGDLARPTETPLWAPSSAVRGPQVGGEAPRCWELATGRWGLAPKFSGSAACRRPILHELPFHRRCSFDPGTSERSALLRCSILRCQSISMCSGVAQSAFGFSGGQSELLEGSWEALEASRGHFASIFEKSFGFLSNL